MKRNLLYAIALLVSLLSYADVFAQTKADGNETWKSVGTGLLRDDAITASYFLNNYWEFEVEMEESEQTPGRYRLVNAYKNCPSVGGDAFPETATNYLVVDASDPKHVYIEQGGTSYYIGVGQQLCLWSIADDYYNNRYGNWNLADEEGVCGTLKDGTITFPKGALLYVPSDTEGEEVFDPDKHDYIWKVCNLNGMFRLKLPGVPNTDASIEYARYDASAEKVHYQVYLGPDIEYCKAALFEGEYSSNMAEQIETGNVKTYEIKGSGDFAVDYEKDGIFTLVLVPYCQGRAWMPAHCTYEWAFSETEWKKLGEGEYTEGIISSNELNNYGFVFKQHTYTVKVEQNVENPALVRLVDPYGPDTYPDATNLNYDTSKRYYLEFDFSDQENVKLLHTDNIGLNLGYGAMEVWSYADRAVNDPNFTPAIQEALFPDGIPTGHYNKESNTASFDAGSFVIMFPSARPNTWYKANQKGAAKLVLPEGFSLSSGIENVNADNDTLIRYYTIDGILVGNSKPAPGLYIMRQGGKSKKVILK